MAEDPKSKAKRTRDLTQEEAALWARIANTAEPLKKAPGPAAPVGQEAAEPPPVERRRAVRQDQPARQAKPVDGDKPSLAPFARREARQITSGRAEIGARIDLHGMRQRQAYPALKAFLQRAHASGHRYVLVITGKGAPEPEEPESFFEERDRGVLKRLVPEWLGKPEFRAWVVTYQTAHQRHGGEGALYVRLRRPDTSQG